jgi:hypothetical protein
VGWQAGDRRRGDERREQHEAGGGHGCFLVAPLAVADSWLLAALGL